MKKIKVTVNRDNSGAHLYDLELVALPPVGTVLFVPSPFHPDDSFPPRYFIVKEVIVDLVADPSGRRAILFVDPKERKLDWADEEWNATPSSEDKGAQPASDEQSEGGSNPGIKCLVTDVGGSFREIFYFQTVPGVGEHLTLGVSKPGEPTIRGGYTVVEVNHHAESNKPEHIVYISIEKYSLGGI